MLRKIRVALAAFMLAACTFLFLDFTGMVHTWLGWVAKIQFLPALLALNAGVMVFLVLLTLLFGRVYCSVICPLGITQDVIAWFGKKRRKNRYGYSKGKTWLRIAFLVIAVAAFVAGIGSIVAVLAPYSFFGRIVSNLFAPLYALANNGLAAISEHFGSYAFYSTDVWIKSLPVFITVSVCFVVLVVLAWRNGRTYCNTVCPVGTVLGFLARYSLFKPVIDTDKCVDCKLCERNCKAACIDIGHHSIDYSRCVACMDCIGKCRKDAMSYSFCPEWKRRGKASAAIDSKEKVPAAKKTFVPDENRRKFLSLSALAMSSAAMSHAANIEKKVDGGLAVIEDKVPPKRNTRLSPPGSAGTGNFSKHCTACQLCVSVCPNGVLRPSAGLIDFMQPEMSYERGYCRPECVKCSEVCPAGAILKITPADKSAIQIGHAVWVRENCVSLTDGVTCGNCARHCPTGAIQMIPSDAGNMDSPEIPVINEAKCIGCGACEYLCPARPFGAIYVEGHERHREI